MLLAAGLGQRMRPLTQDRPKPLLSVLGRPMALQNLRRFDQAGISRAVINLHYCGDALRDAIGEGGSEGLPELLFTVEDPVLGTGGGLRNAAPYLIGEGPILAHNADFLSDIDFESLLSAHLDADNLATLVLAPPRPGYSIVDLDASGRVISLAGTPAVERERITASYLFTGCQILDESLMERLPADRPSNIVTDLYQQLAAEGRLGAYLHDGFWWEFGSPAAFLNGSLELLGLDETARSKIADHDPVRELGGCARVATGPGVELDDQVQLIGRCALAMASRIGRSSVLTDTVVMEESWIGPECRLERVIVGPHTELPAGFQATDAIVCPDLTPDAEPTTGIERHEGLLIRPFAL